MGFIEKVCVFCKGKSVFSFLHLESKVIKISFLLFTLFFFKISAIAQPKYTISGYVKDSLSSESLLSASIYNLLNKEGTSSNNFGFYSITLPAGKVEMVFSYMGYNTQKHVLTLTSDTILSVSLNAVNLINAATVLAKAKESGYEQVQMSSISINMNEAKALPAFMGEVDLMKILQLTPGVQSGGEGSSGLYVRGGGPDQNLILLDGVPVYNASHLFGFFSVFNPDAINKLELFKGGFPARYGGRTSSVIDINMKEGNSQEFHGEGAIGIISAKLSLEGPIIKDKTSFIVSARRTYIDAISKPLIKSLQNTDENEKINLGYYFYDMTAKINHRFSDKDRLFLSTYMGQDKFYLENEYTSSFNSDDDFRKYKSKNESGIKWGNLTTALRWNHIFTKKLFGNTSLTYSKFQFITSVKSHLEDTEQVDQAFSLKYKSSIEDLAARINFDYLPSPNHYIRFGVNAINHRFSPGAMGIQSNLIADTTLGASSLWGNEFSLYAEDDVRISHKFKFNAGIHWSAFSIRNQLYQQVQPRFSARYLISDRLSVKASYSRMAQYIHLLSNSGIGLPTDLWVPSTEILKPQTSDQIAAGVVRNLKGNYELSAELYYKKMDKVTEYKEGSSFFDLDKEWERKVLQGDGRAYGLELFAQKKSGQLTGWIGYTLSWTDRQFAEINQGRRYYYKYDRRHDFSIVGMYRPNPRHELSATWVFGTGTAVTVPIALINVQDYSQLKIYSDRNAYRMAPYHRLDLSISFIKAKKWGERRWVIGIYNAYARQNPFYIDYKTEVRFSETGYREEFNTFVQYSLFSIIPSISYQFKF